MWFLCDQGVSDRKDTEFGNSFAWDLPMVEGYRHRFLEIPNWNLRKPITMRLRHSLKNLFRQVGATHLWVEGWRFPAFWQAVYQAKQAGLQVWCRGESNDLSPAPSPPKRWVKRPLLAWFFRQVDAFLCIGAANRRLYLKYGVPPSRLASAPYCVDNQRFRDQAARLRSQRSDIRSQWGIAEEFFCILFAGKFIPKKRPLDIVKAAQALINNNQSKNLHLLFVGSGELAGDLRSQCNVAFDREDPNLRPLASKIKPLASFVGFLNQSKICSAYVAADCLALSSDAGETWGLVVNEAMACGLPCVVSDACGCAEDLVAPLDQMLRYPCCNVQALADALQRVVRSRPSPSEIDRVIEGHNMRRTVREVKQLLVADLESSTP